jgi:hypothetical protein
MGEESQRLGTKRRRRSKRRRRRRGKECTSSQKKNEIIPFSKGYAPFIIT